MKTNFHHHSLKLKIPKNCPAISWKYNNPNGDGDFDEEMLPLLKPLNNDKWHTVASCAGHSENDLKNPLVGYGVKSPYRICIYIHVRIDAMDEFIEMTNAMSQTSDSFWCELGYNADELSNKTEEGYLPFYIQIFCGAPEERNRTLVDLVDIIEPFDD